MHLYEIAEQYRELMADFEENSDEQMLKNQLDNITTEFNDKAEGIGKIVKEFEYECDIIDLELKRLSARKTVAENKIKWLKSYVLEQMLASGIEKIPGQLLTLSLRKAPVSVVILDQALIPERFIRTIPEVKEPNKSALIADFKSTGEEQPGCEYITDKKTVQIK